MAIVRERVPFVDVEALSAALLRVGGSTLRLFDGDTVTGSCWCLTDSLVIAPGFSLTAAKRPGLSESASGKRVEARVEARLNAASTDEELLVLRASAPFDGRAVTLRLASLEAGEPLMILQYPEGRARVILSTGFAVAIEGGRLAHDANTTDGSAGGAVVDLAGRFVGMHVSTDRTRALNIARTTDALLAQLRAAPCWPEIAAHHKIATIATSPQRPQPRADLSRVLPYALRWSIASAALDASEHALLRPHVVDPTAAVWRMKPALRREAIEQAGSFDALRAARGTARFDSPGQSVIDRILRGAPFDLEAEPFDGLPFWLQVSRWFEGVVPGVPSAATVHAVTERRRVRERLAEIIGEDFSGRSSQLAQMDAWLARADVGVMVIWGPGGIGKSALVARFAQRLVSDAMLLWLDFDRADLAPDDDASIVAALATQVRAQRDVQASEALGELDALGALLGREAKTPLLVLDSFEVAQHAPRHEAIWKALEALIARAPALHVLVSGRAPVGDVRVAGRPVEPVELTRLSDADADALLQHHSERLVRDLSPDEAASKRASYPLFDAATRARVAALSKGSPLLLTLAARLFEEGGDIDGLPPRWTEAYLYQRILDRVVDPSLRELARGALVLRRLTVPSIEGLLSASLPANLGAQEAFVRIKREMALVTGDEVLRVRPELRASTLRLLESADSTFVRDLDARAARWYADQGGVENATEAVYHWLRAEDPAQAERVWRDALGGALLDALREARDDLDGDALAWLDARLRAGAGTDSTQEAWERDALRRVRDALARGVPGAAADTLGERAERLPASELRFFDAWVALVRGDAVSAERALVGAESLGGEVGWRERVLRALAASRRGERREADLWLSRAETMPIGGPIERAAVVAARLRLTLELGAEARLLGVREDWLTTGLNACDALLPDLQAMLRRAVVLESASQWYELDLASPDRAIRVLQRVYADRALPFEDAHDTTDASPLWDRARVVGNMSGVPLDHEAVTVALSGRRRWVLATRPGALEPLFELATSEAFDDPLAVASLSALTLFAETSGWPLSCSWKGESVEAWLERSLLNLSRSSLGTRLRALEGDDDERVYRQVTRGRPASALEPGQSSVQEAAAMLLAGRHGVEASPLVVLFYLLPDPLVMLAQRLGGALLPSIER